jgi:hypothetical protein
MTKEIQMTKGLLLQADSTDGHNIVDGAITYVIQREARFGHFVFRFAGERRARYARQQGRVAAALWAVSGEGP